ncbi:MAG: hypothetical protein ACPGMX_09285, partial [Paracoccaceae bacterium]
AVALHSKHGNSPTLRLEQDGSSGFTSQTWDIAGNETNFFVRDVTNGSLLPFRIVPGSPTSSVMIKPDAIEMGVGTQEVDVKTGIKFSENTADDLVNGIEFTDGSFGCMANFNLSARVFAIRRISNVFCSHICLGN